MLLVLEGQWGSNRIALCCCVWERRHCWISCQEKCRHKCKRQRWQLSIWSLWVELALAAACKGVEVLTEGVCVCGLFLQVTFQIVLVDGCIWRCSTLPLNLVSGNDDVVEQYVYVVFHIVLVQPSFLWFPFPLLWRWKERLKSLGLQHMHSNAHPFFPKYVNAYFFGHRIGNLIFFVFWWINFKDFESEERGFEKF